MYTTLSHNQRSPVTHVIHIADVHIRVGDHKTSRAQEYKHVLNSLCDDLENLPCVQNNTALLVIAGDVFHNKGRLDSVMGTIFFDWINRLLDTLPVLVICGNHDFRQEDPTFTDMIEWFTTPYLTTTRKYPIHYLQSTGQYLWENLNFGLVSIKDTLRAANTSGIVDELPPFPAPLHIPGISCTIALFHGTVSKSRLPSGRTVEDKTYPLEWFEGYDIAMLGDIHKQQIDTYKTLQWGYPGSLVQQDFGETTDGHGYIIWDIENKTGQPNSIYNPYAAITISNTSAGYTVHFTPKDAIPLRDAIDLPCMPKQPKVRLLGSYLDEVTITNTLKAFDIQPSFIKCSIQQFYSNEETLPSKDITPLADLNSTDAWKEYLGTLDVGEWIDAPAKMTVPTLPELPEEISHAITSRNAKIKSLIDAYDAEKQRIVTKHHHINLKYMEWQYLMCYGKLNYFDFERIDAKIALLSGPNATGKSAFMDVICIALYGEPTLSRREFTGNLLTAKIIHDDRPPTESAFVSLIFSVDDTLYEVYRTFTQQQENDLIQQKVVAIYHIADNEKHTVAEGVVMVNQWILQHIGSPEEIMMSSMLCQNDNANFFYQKPADQKLILEKALHMENIRAFENVLEEATKAHKYTLEKVVCYHKGLSDDDQTSAADVNEKASLEQELHRITPEINRLTIATNALLSKIGDKTNLVIRDDLPQQIDALRSNIHEEISDDQLMIRTGQLQERKAKLLESYIEGPYEHTLADYKDALLALEQQISEHQHRRPSKPDLTLEIISKTQKEYDKWASNKVRYDDNLENIVNELESMEVTKPEKHSAKQTLATVADIRDALSKYHKLIPAWIAHTEKEPPRGMSLEDCESTIAAYTAWQAQQPATWLKSKSAAEKERDRLQKLVDESKATVKELLNYRVERAEHKQATKVADLQQAISELQSINTNITLSRPADDPVALKAWLKRRREWEAFLKKVPDDTAANLQNSLNIATEIQDLQQTEFNPECYACCKQPKYIRLQHLQKLATDQQRTVAQLKEAAHVRKEYEDRVEAMEHEIREWDRSEKDALALKELKDKRTKLAASVWLTWDHQIKQSTAALDKATAGLAKAEKFIRERDALQPSYKRAVTDVEKARHYQEWSQQKSALRAQVDAIASELWSMYSATLKHNQHLLAKQKQHAQEAAEWERRMSMIRGQRDLVEAWSAWESKASDLEAQRHRTAWICQWLVYVEDEQSHSKISHLKKELDIYRRSILYMEWKALTQEKDALLRRQHDAIESLARINADLTRMLGKSVQLAAVKACLDDLTQRYERLCEFKKRFIGEKQDGFKAFIYKDRVAPLIETEVNAFVANIDQFRLRIKVKNNRFIYLLDDRGNLPTLDHASGYQKFIVGLGMRIALSRIGAVGQNLKHLFLDEGFVAMDADNLQKTHELLRDIMSTGGYRSMILMSHLETIKDATDVRINVVRDTGRSSQLRVGERRMPLKKSARSALEPPKKRGRPRKLPSS